MSTAGPKGPEERGLDTGDVGGHTAPRREAATAPTGDGTGSDGRLWRRVALDVPDGWDFPYTPQQVADEFILEVPVIVTWLDKFQPRTAQWHQWQDAEPSLAGRDFPSIRRYLLNRGVPTPQKDEVLASLIRRGHHADGSEQARVAIIACLLPGARSVATRHVAYLGRHDAIAEVVMSLWLQLGRFELSRHHVGIASRLLSVARHDVARRARGEQTWHERTNHDLDLEAIAEPSDATRRVCVADAIKSDALNPLDVTLIEATRIRGLTLVDAALLLGTSYEAAKKRRRRAEAIVLAQSAQPRELTFASSSAAA